MLAGYVVLLLLLVIWSVSHNLICFKFGTDTLSAFWQHALWEMNEGMLKCQCLNSGSHDLYPIRTPFLCWKVKNSDVETGLESSLLIHHFVRRHVFLTLHTEGLICISVVWTCQYHRSITAFRAMFSHVGIFEETSNWEGWPVPGVLHLFIPYNRPISPPNSLQHVNKLNLLVYQY